MKKEMQMKKGTIIQMLKEVGQVAPCHRANKNGVKIQTQVI